VVGYDVSAEARKAAEAAGTETASSPGAAARRSDLNIVVVGFDDEVEAALFGKGGVGAAAPRGSAVAIASTIAPRAMAKIGARFDGSGVTPLDIPLCRGEPAAEAGKLLVMGGGDAATFERCRPTFEAFADSVFHLGALGAGQVGKMVNNLILWACISANTEGLKLAGALGVEPAALRAALLDSSAGNWALETQIDRHPMPWAEKDMTIVLAEADKARLSLPLCGVIKEVIKGIKIARGEGMPAHAD
jgi:3-hydroxyisobutyrate dehydrogenase-like beta-hydroxyacid dehydrogenase